jgi:hypothetical protein
MRYLTPYFLQAFLVQKINTATYHDSRITAQSARWRAGE